MTMTHPWTDEDEKPLPKQPESTEGPFQLQRPSVAEIAQINDPWGESLSSRLLVLDRYLHRVARDPARPSHREKVPGIWGHYLIHGDTRPSLFKTWARARSTALGSMIYDRAREAQAGGGGTRPGAILMFDLANMPCVTSEEEMRRVARRPRMVDSIECAGELELAERMVDKWARYAADLQAEEKRK